MRCIKHLLPLLLFCRTVCCRGRRPEEEAGALESYMVLPESEKNILRQGKDSSGTADKHFLWTHATVPYEISKEYDSDETRVIEAAMATISNQTCIRFVPHRKEKHFIVFRDGSGCSSHVGRQPRVRGQTVTLEKRRCVTKGTVMHELMHTIGFQHEQSRPDRDDYVIVLEDNIEKDEKHNFKKDPKYSTFDFPYDYDSIMHYGDNYFGKKKWFFGSRLKTLKPKKSGVEIGQRERLSYYDILKIRKMYSCDKPKGTVRNVFRPKPHSSRKRCRKSGKKSLPG